MAGVALNDILRMLVEKYVRNKKDEESLVVTPSSFSWHEAARIWQTYILWEKNSNLASAGGSMDDYLLLWWALGWVSIRLLLAHNPLGGLAMA